MGKIVDAYVNINFPPAILCNLFDTVFLCRCSLVSESAGARPYTKYRPQPVLLYAKAAAGGSSVKSGTLPTP